MTDTAPRQNRASSGGSAASQTLSRGIRILEILAEAPSPLSIDDVASELGVHRSNAYRLLRTFEEHGLVGRDSSGRLALGARMASLAASVAHDLQAEALPELSSVANELGMTCFLAVRDRDQCTTLVSVEPRHAIASVAQRPGASHPMTAGAPGKAIVAQLPRREWPADMSEALRSEIDDVVARGFATSYNEVIPSVQSVAVPLALRGRQPAAVAVVHVAPTLDVDRIVDRLTRSTAAISDALGG
ncbi:IclR family transcriptional regulator [Paramicrobacterium agarici]|uniref:IclR family transcriptional regulator n=1 Tax=Paramicrobacterium agarici TaxID=630514 RepID=UPI00115284EC|nr:IclR family transcriptional regulator [Microbacterium agarici]TQO22223.1 IclR family transcriptional regulator [Microbacterium agarici]